jgi:hypothetical protein
MKLWGAAEERVFVEMLISNIRCDRTWFSGECFEDWDAYPDCARAMTGAMTGALPRRGIQWAHLLRACLNRGTSGVSPPVPHVAN